MKASNGERLPEGWSLETIANVAEVNPHLSKDSIAGDLPVSFVPMPAVGAGDGTIDVSRERPFSEVKKGFTPFREGDVLFAKITPCMENGKMAVVPKLKNGYGFGSTEFHVLRPKNGMDPRYLYYYVSNKSFRADAEHHMSGAVGQKRVPTAYLRECQIPVAPPDQQERIVAEIEKQFSRLDEAVANLKRVKANLKRYKAAVLKAAVEGKLTEEWRKAHLDVEPASELLKRILAERRAKWEETQLAKMKAADKDPKGKKWKTKYEEAELVDNEPVSDTPSGWLWASLDTLIVWGPQNGLYLPKSAYRAGIAILRIDDYQDGKSRPSSELQQVAATEEDVQKYSLEKNDLVINRVNSPSHLGKCLVVQGRNLPSLFESNMMRLKLASDIDVGFVELYLRSDTGKSQLIKNAKWAVNQASINQEDVRSTALSLPPLIEQKAIVKEAERLWSLMGGLDEAVNLGFKRAERLRQSILCQAFQGRLLNREYKPKSSLQQDLPIAAESASNYGVPR